MQKPLSNRKPTKDDTKTQSGQQSLEAPITDTLDADQPEVLGIRLNSLLSLGTRVKKVWEFQLIYCQKQDRISSHHN
uniref:Uncharacterized protein n=1 Tax=Lepeophtheirus salmonis TaxID=72036 RepID=A0A0K2U9F3_LEPSM